MKAIRLSETSEEIRKGVEKASLEFSIDAIEEDPSLYFYDSETSEEEALLVRTVRLLLSESGAKVYEEGEVSLYYLPSEDGRDYYVGDTGDNDIDEIFLLSSSI